MSDVANRIEELKKRKAEREEKLRQEAEARELEELELEDKLSSEIGVRGKDFEIINTDIGLFAVKKPDFVVAKRFNAAETKGEEEIIQFVRPCLLFPDATRALAQFQAHAGAASRCCLALIAMHEAAGVARAGKF